MKYAEQKIDGEVWDFWFKTGIPEGVILLPRKHKEDFRIRHFSE